MAGIRFSAAMVSALLAGTPTALGAQPPERLSQAAIARGINCVSERVGPDNMGLFLGAANSQPAGQLSALEPKVVPIFQSILGDCGRQQNWSGAQTRVMSPLSIYFMASAFLRRNHSGGMFCNMQTVHGAYLRLPQASRLRLHSSQAAMTQALAAIDRAGCREGEIRGLLSITSRGDAYVATLPIGP